MDPNLIKIVDRVTRRWKFIPGMTDKDVRQEAIVGVLEAAKDHPGASVGELYNRTRDHLDSVAAREWTWRRKAGKQMPVLHDDDGEPLDFAGQVPDRQPLPPALASSRELGAVLRHVLRTRITEREYRVVEAKYLHHKDDATVAMGLGIERRSVQKIRTRTLRKLRRILVPHVVGKTH